MVKLNSLNGSENLPQKKFWKGKVTDEQTETQKERFAFNEAVDALHSIELTGDVEELAKALQKSQYSFDTSWDEVDPVMKAGFRTDAQALINSMASWVQLTKGK